MIMGIFIQKQNVMNFLILLNLTVEFLALRQLKELFLLFNRKFEIIKQNENTLFLDNITQDEIIEKQKQIKNKYYSIEYKGERNNNSRRHNKSKLLLETITSSFNHNKDQQRYLIEETKIPKPIVDISQNFVKNKIRLSNTLKEQNLEIELININYDKNNYSIQSLLNFYSKCIFSSRILPLFVSKAFKEKNKENINKAGQIFISLYHYYEYLTKFKNFSP